MLISVTESPCFLDDPKLLQHISYERLGQQTGNMACHVFPMGRAMGRAMSTFQELGTDQQTNLSPTWDFSTFHHNGSERLKGLGKPLGKMETIGK